MNEIPFTRVVVTPAEFRTLRAMLVDAANNKEIAKRLFVCEDTVKTTLRKVYAKLGVRGRMAAAVMVYSGEVDVVTITAAGVMRHLMADIRNLRVASSIDSWLLDDLVLQQALAEEENSDVGSFAEAN